MFGSVATSNVTTSCIVPSFAFVDCMYSMLSTPFICCSSGRRDRLLDRESIGTVVSGRHGDLRRDDVGETGRSAATASRPGRPARSRFATTMATMGLLMKNLDIGLLRFRRRREWLGVTTVPSVVRAPSTTTRAPGCNPSSTIQRLPMRSPTFTVFVLTLSSGPTHAELKRSLELTHRALRHQQHVCPHVRFRRGRAVLSGPQRPVGLGNVALIRIVPVFASISRSAARNEPLRG